MNNFLASLRPRLLAEPKAHVVLVTGNESADLDSIVSALSTSFFLSRPSPNRSKIILPFINIPKIDLALRSDVTHVLSTTDINRDLIFFRDDLSILEQLVSKKQLSLFLVDHNKVSGTMNSLNQAPVVGLLDHHVDEKLYQDAKPRRVEMVGSCASLVASEFFQSAIESDQEQGGEGGKKPSSGTPWANQLARLLLGPILIDTMNLNPEMKKVQPLDTAMTNLILPHTGWDSTDELYNNINNARRDTSNLSFFDLLRKDYKEWTVTQHTTGQPIKVGISSVVGLVAKYVERDGKEALHQSIHRWAKERDLGLVLVLFSENLGEHGGFKRQVVVDTIADSVKGFSEQLEKVPLFQFERTTVMDTNEFLARGGHGFWQGNVACSRKQVWPEVEKLLTQPAQDSNL